MSTMPTWTIVFSAGTRGDKTKTAVVAKDRETKMVKSSAAPAKGTGHGYPARVTRAFINELGHERLDVVIKNLRSWARPTRSRDCGHPREP